MRANAFGLDLTMMYAVHDALRRELERIARITARQDDDARRVLRTAVGWEMFKSYLGVHHATEDAALWPVMYAELADRPDDLALLDAMEVEHAAIDPLLTAVDDALADRDSGPQRLGDLVDALAGGLTGHLRHEEHEALPLIDATLSGQQWQNFGREHGARLRDDASRYLPWLLDGVDPERTAIMLDRFMPEPLRVAYRAEWAPAYAGLGLWIPTEDSGEGR